MKRILLIAMIAPLVIFLKSMSMEELVEKGAPKISPSMHISYIEALLAGGRFCINTEEGIIEFKHYNKEKHFTFPIKDLEKLAGAVDIFSIKNKESDYEHPDFTPPCTIVKTHILRAQLKRLKKFNKDILFGNSEEYISAEFMDKKRAERLDIALEAIASEKEVPKKVSMLIEDRAYRHPALLAQRNKNRQNLRDALLEKDSFKIDAACNKLLWASYDNLTRDPRLKKIEERRLFRKKFAMKEPHLKYVISFFESIMSGPAFQNFDNEKQTLQFKHFNKENLLTASLFITHGSIYRLYEDNRGHSPIAQLVRYLNESYTTREAFIETLSLLKHPQRKMLITALRVIRYFEFLVPFCRNTNRAQIKQALKEMPSERRNILDGCSSVFSNQQEISEERKLHIYAGKLVQKARHQMQWLNFLDSKNAGGIATWTTPLALEFVPFHQEFEEYEAAAQEAKNEWKKTL